MGRIMDTAAFQSAYDRLNPAQKQAVDTIEGPVMVIAGPGTGKTQILTLRIANILMQTDVRPENILALTFTESGAAAMRDRLRTYIGAAAYRVAIHTFHGFAETLIRAYPDAYPRVIGGRPASDLEKVSIIESILESGGYKLLRPSGSPSYYVTPIIRTLSTLKQEYITPERFAVLIAEQETDLAATPKVHEKGAHKGKVRGEYTKKEKAIEKNRELLAVYRTYEQLLSDQNLYDFEDMIVETVEALKGNDDMRLDLQETYQYLLADEHQDVNGSQNAILDLLARYHDRPNIFVVGDEKQAIYRFQGASLENFLYFEDAFAHTATIALTENYRSGQPVLDASHSLIAVDAGVLADLRVPLTAQPDASAQVTLRNFSHQVVEDTWVVDSIADTIQAGTSAEEIAVIVRTNREVEHMAAALRQKGLAVRASADGDILTHPVTDTVCNLIEAVAGRDPEAALFRLLHGAYWGISQADLVRVLRARSYDTPLAAIIADPDRLADCGVRDPDAVLKVADVLAHARAAASTTAPHTVLAQMVEASGLLAHIMNTAPVESGRVLRRLYDEIEAMVREDRARTLGDVQTVFARLRAYNLSLTAPYISTNTHAVQVMTAHKSKGLEFNVVYIPHLVDRGWGGSGGRTFFDIPLASRVRAEDLDPADDERRLLYVAMTRARRTLNLSHAATNTDGKDLTPSRLLTDVDEAFISVAATDEAEDSFDPVRSLLRTPISVEPDVQLFVEALRERGLSATSLNNYLASPWNYVYRNVLRIPEVQPEHMLFGTALHDVMERVTRHHTAHGAIPNDTDIKRFLEQALARLPLTTEAYTRRHEQGFAALTAYLANRAPTLPQTTREEFTLKVTMSTGLPNFPEVVLTGKLDRLDLDAEGNVVRVVDYKTGKPKTRNVIEGKTKHADGGYKRQLVFYALLLSLYEPLENGAGRYNQAKEYVLSFLEPDSKGRVCEESFAVTSAEIEALKQEIIEVVVAITNGTFLTSPCDSSVCDYCPLVHELFGGEME